MSDKSILSNQEQEQLVKLFDGIKLDLTVTDFPTRTNRLEAVENMKRVLEIHGYEINHRTDWVMMKGGMKVSTLKKHLTGEEA